MNWITNYVRPRINSLFSRRDVPENLWTKCPECGTMLFHRELAENLQVCTNCGHHLPITPRDRFAALFDSSNDPDAELSSVNGYDCMLLLAEALKRGRGAAQIRGRLRIALPAAMGRMWIASGNSFWMSMPRLRKWCFTHSHAPRAVMPIFLWS